MSDIAIRVENLGKAYRITSQRQQGKRYKTLQEELLGVPGRLWNMARGYGDGRETVWALKDVSLEVREGEVVGIIGRNGAGKTTLLKILSRITEPTEGQATVYGRVGSLLEVGTGFHPELTGRENVFLNGAILGMTRQEVHRRFDEIVAFAEVEQYIDTPVKRYSSGMQVRLAFAVAAYLEPEILLVDEVLAVGDVEFQKKCLGKMQDVASQGRTVFFVSHNIPAITRLCQRTILLGEGRVLQDGPCHQVVSTYLTSDLGTTTIREWPDLDKAPGDDVVRLRAVYLRIEDRAVSDVVDIHHPFAIVMVYDVLKSGMVFTTAFRFTSQDGVILFTSFDSDSGWSQQPRPKGQYTSMVSVPGDLLAEGTVVVMASIACQSPIIKHVRERDVIAFQVVDNLHSDSVRIQWAGEIPGVVRPRLHWVTEYKATSS